MAKKTAKNETEASERKTWKQGAIGKAQRMERLANALVKKGDDKAKKAGNAMLEGLKALAAFLASVPDDFKLAGDAAPRKSIEVGDMVSIVDEILEMYPCGKGPHKVKAVKRIGGNPETGFKGSKLFVVIETKRGDLTVPSSVLE